MKARLRDLSVNYENGNAIASFELESLPEIIEKYRGKELEIKISQYFRRRSLNANAYYWVLCNQLAGARGMTNTEMHNFLLAEYGKFDGLEIAMRPDIDWMKLNDIHLRPTKRKEGSYDVYQVIKGSHEYDTEEMSKLIDGVIREANGEGIETITPQEKEWMMQKYDKAWKRKQVSQSEDDV